MSRLVLTRAARVRSVPFHCDVRNSAVRRGRLPLANHETASHSRATARDLEHLCRALLKRWRVFAAVAGGFVAIVALATLLMPKSYTTTVRLLAGRSDSQRRAGRQGTALPVLNALVLQSGVQSAETFAALAQQRDIASRVVTQLNLQASPKELLGHVSVQPIANTALLNFNVRWSSPERSARHRQRLRQRLRGSGTRLRPVQAVAAIDYLSKEMPDAANQMHADVARASRSSKPPRLHRRGRARAGRRRPAMTAHRPASRSARRSMRARPRRCWRASAARWRRMSTTVNSAQQVEPQPGLRRPARQARRRPDPACRSPTKIHAGAPGGDRASPAAGRLGRPNRGTARGRRQPDDRRPQSRSIRASQQQATTYRARIEGDEGRSGARGRAPGLLGPRSRRCRSRRCSSRPFKRKPSALPTSITRWRRNTATRSSLRRRRSATSSSFSRPRADTAVKHPSLRMNLPIAHSDRALTWSGRRLRARSDRAAVAPAKTSPGSWDCRWWRGFPPSTSRSSARCRGSSSMTVEAFLHLCVTHAAAQQTPDPKPRDPERAPRRGQVDGRLSSGKTPVDPAAGRAADRRGSASADAARDNVLRKHGWPERRARRLRRRSNRPCSTSRPGLDILPSGPDTANPVSLLARPLRGACSTTRARATAPSSSTRRRSPPSPTA